MRRFVRIAGAATAAGSALLLGSCKVPPAKLPAAVETPSPRPEAPDVSASSVENNDPAYQPAYILDGDTSTRWSSAFSDPQWIEIDLGAVYELSGADLLWEAAHATAYELRLSRDGENWVTVYQTDAGDGGTDEIRFETQPARFVRLVATRRATAFGYSLFEVTLKGADGQPLPEAFLPSVRRFYELAARRAPGCYPRWLSGQQAFWTILGVADDDKESIFCEDGTIEPRKRGFTLMPLVFANGELVSRDHTVVSQSLAGVCLPLPSVHWRGPDGLEMDITALAWGDPGESSTYARYTIRNGGTGDLSGRLFLALRPFQLYPPWQGEGEGENEEEGKGLGGMARVTSVRRTADGLEINGKYRIALLTPPDGFGTQAGHPPLRAPFTDPVVEGLLAGRLPEGGDAENPDGGVSAVLAYGFRLAPGAEREVFVAIPLHAAPPALSPEQGHDAVAAGFQRMLDEAVAFWGRKVNPIDLEIPEPGWVETFKANIGYSFITKDGPALQPGTWCYDKAWIRDGSIAALAFLRLGYTNEARAFLDWYTAYQFESGEIPCVIDNKARNPFWEGISEYDSQGEYIHAILDYFLFTKDRAWLEEKLTNVVRALQFAERLRATRLTPEYLHDPDKVLLRGLVSNSYANHNYSDNFWTLRGWRDGARIARILGREDVARWAAENHRALRASVLASIEGAMRKHGIDFIPEYPEGKHFWPASIAFGVACCDEAESMPSGALRRTFELTHELWQSWKQPGTEYRFTPEEMPIAETYLYLGWRDRAVDFLRFMLAHRKPLAWMQWPEVVNSDERKPTIFGDMPHTWIGAQYILAVRNLLVQERGDMLVLGRGVDPAWLESGQPVAIRNAPTHFGRISLELRKEGDRVTARVDGDAVAPDGIVQCSPLARAPAEVRVNGAAVPLPPNGRVKFQALPAEIVFAYGNLPG